MHRIREQALIVIYPDLPQTPKPKNCYTSTERKMPIDPIVKICGLTTVDAAEVAIESGADLLGMIMVPNRQRTVDLDIAKQISVKVREARDSRASTSTETKEKDWFDLHINRIKQEGPFLVGVFRNQPLSTILEYCQSIPLDYVQLHGSEDRSQYIPQIPVPVIARFVPKADDFKESVQTGLHALPLIDGEVGGEGKLLDWNKLGIDSAKGKYILAGGLNPDNVSSAVQVEGVIGVDVSGGVETSGKKDADKIREFIDAARKRNIITNT